MELTAQEEKLVEKSYLQIYLNKEDGYVYTNWIGTPSVDKVKEGLDLILDAMKEHEVYKILNDNRELTGTWTGAIEWITNDWMPRALQTNYKGAAMIYSPDVFGKFAVDSYLRKSEGAPIEQAPFKDYEEAKAWLKAL